MEPKLLSCPFCGYIPDLDDPDVLYPINRERTIWNICCPQISGGCDCSILGEDADECIRKWNSRKTFD